MSTDQENLQSNPEEHSGAHEESRYTDREYRKVNYNRDENNEGRPYRPVGNRYGNDGGNTYGQNRPRRPRITRPSAPAGEPAYRAEGNEMPRPRRPRIGGSTPAYHSDGNSGGYRNENSGYRNENSGYRNENGGYRQNNRQRSYNPNFRNSNNGEQQRPWRQNNYNYNNNGGGRYENTNRYDNNNRYEPGNRWENSDGQQPQRSNFRRPNNNGGYNRPNGGYRQQGGGYNQGGYRQPQGGGYNNNRQRGNFRPHRTAGYDPNAKYSHKKQIEYKDILTDPNEPIRLNKFLANAGVCSRREADEYITAGVVSVNGQVVTELGTKIKRSDEVKFHDQPVNIERKVYVLLNKPKDCVTTSDDPRERKTVMDCVKGACKERIYPVGRLDRNTTGVLLLTNDGDLASKLTHPKYLKKKIYHVHCDKPIAQADIDKIAAGITLDDGEIHADSISYSSDTDKAQVGIEIHSGKNRIVRRIFESLGYRVTRLDRVFFAGLTKKNLRRGQWRYLTEKEVNMLRMGAFE